MFNNSNPRGLNTWDILSIVALAITLCLAGYFLMIFINPFTPLNPLQPPTPLTPLAFPTATWTPLQLPPTFTPTATIEPTPSRTLAPTWTPFAASTQVVLPTITSRFTPTRTRTPTRTPRATGMPFIATITPIASTIIHPEAGCNWIGVGGEASDLNNSPVLYLIVRVGGSLGGQIIDPNLHTTVTGIAPQYGKAGFEFVLGDKPIASTGSMWIQLLDQAGLPLSDKIYFDTSDSCDQNLILIRFKKTR